MAVANSKIEWTESTWSPVTGCTKVSQGCKNCYAERMWKRLSAPNMPYEGRAFTDVQCHHNRLDKPLRWKKPRRVFVNSMSDLFHEDVPDSFIDQVFAVMALARQHTFQVLTKRPARMHEYMTANTGNFETGHAMGRIAHLVESMRDDDDVIGPMPWGRPGERWWPLPHVWLGVSIEDQATADERIPLLLQTPAAVRWISAEPLLGPVDFNLDALWCEDCSYCEDEGFTEPDTGAFVCSRCDSSGKSDDVLIDWVVVGGESGPKARPMALGWAKDIVRQCQTASVPVFVKQMGANPTNREGEPCPHIKHKKGADMSEWPHELRVREYPA